MVSKFQQFIIIGAAMGLSGRMGELLQGIDRVDGEPFAGCYEHDQRRLDRAERKRQRRLERNKKNISPTS